MSVENSKVIDFISEKANKIVLTISDHLQWDEDKEHIYLLQEKINAYLMAIESGQLQEKYPASIGKKITISIAFKYEPNENGILFLSNVKDILSNTEYGFHYSVFK